MMPMREILNAVLRHDGRAFAIEHNYPSGDATPSDADRGATAEVAAAARTAGLRFLGHIVIAGTDWCTAT
jgi:DNA repair protein RadC